MLKSIIASLRIRRLEYRLAEAPLFLIPIVMATGGPFSVFDWRFVEALFIFLFIFAFGDIVNCLMDRELDATWKPHLADAVAALGVRNVILQATLSAAASVVLTVHLAWMLDRWLLVPGVLFALAAAYAYSAPPIHFKSRGVWQLAFYWLGLFAGPMGFTLLMFTAAPTLPMIAVILAYGVMQTGVLLGNTAEDYPEDIQMGVHTAVVALGLSRSMTLAAVLVPVGGVLLMGAILWLRPHAGVPASSAALTPFVAGLIPVSIAMAVVARRVAGEPLEQGISRVKRAARYVPLAITLLAFGSLWAVWRMMQA